MALADEVFAQSTTSPWTQAVQALQTAFTGPIATGLALVAIVVGGLMEIAEEHGPKVIDGRVVIPDLRLEYETPDHEQSRVDLEVVTGNYRSGGLSTKARAGFRMYASAADQVRLRRAMTDPEIMQEIFSL